MAHETPPFWWQKPGALSCLLSPAAWIYGFFARRNMETRQPPAIHVPVLCVGNFTLGGAGKTPVVIAFVQAAKEMGLKPGVVSRGYGGSVSGTHRVDIRHDRARDVGDEALLLAKHAEVVVAKDRYSAAQMLARDGCNIILMDDGFQSRRLHADYALLVVDALRGIGNGSIFPSGPLRAPLLTQLAYTDSVLVIGEGMKGEEAVRFAARAGKPVYRASLVSSTVEPFENRRFLAFAGIGNPQKFFAGIEETGGIVEQTRVFADHHFFSSYDMDDIAASAREHGLDIATTAKDYVRLKTDGLDKKLDRLFVFDVGVVFKTSGFCKNILNEVLARYKDRSLR